MNAGPVIVRELRAEARRPVNHWLRLLAAGAGIAVGVSLLASSRLPPMLLGGHLFATLHTALFLTFLVVVPLMTADCVSQERREGTLGLLFLTPLTALDIVAGKSLVHIVRALTLFLAVIPVLTLPFLLGGVGRRDVATAITIEACAVLLGMAGGLLATSKSGTAMQVMVWAELFAVLLTVVAGLGFILILLGSSVARLPLSRPSWFEAIWELMGGTGALVTGVFNGRAVWTNLFMSAPAWRLWTRVVVETLLFCVLLFGLVLVMAVSRLKSTWQDEAPDHEQPRWVRIFANSDFWRAVFRWDKSRTLDRNPIAWLQEYSWTARLTKWGWCLVTLCGELFVLNHWEQAGGFGWQPALTWALLLGLAFSAVSSFRRERQAGLLELLLVTPLSSQQLIQGRLWGVWCHFLPATAILVVGRMSQTVLVAYPTGLRSAASAALPLVSTYLALPVLGLYFSLWRVHVLVAWLLTVILGALVPVAAVAAFYSLGQSVWRMDIFTEPGFAVITWCAVQAGLATFAGRLLHGHLVRREFALQAT
ncbi:MAG: hypothetical protein KGS61_16160 [Verrucomicrobia bacterium]|nr:hypothetical protein [Verrucomicrobiota bacterium]